MRTFDYKGYDQSGRAVRGLIEALDERQARERLSQRGVLTEKISGAGEQRSLRKLNSSSRDMFYHELGTLLRAGLPLTRALDVMIDSPEAENIAHLLARVRDGIKEGGSLSEAMSNGTAGISGFELAALNAGEQSGALAQVCLRLGDFYKRRARVIEELRTALTYPLIVLAAAIAVATGMLGFMLGRFEEIWVEAGIELPALTRVVIATGKYGVFALPLIAALVFLAIIALRRRSRESKSFRMRWHRTLFRIPICKRVYTALTNLRFTSTLSLLVDGGVQLAEATRVAGRATGNAWLETEIDSVGRDISHGAKLSDSIRRIPPLAGSLPGWISAGEESGDLSSMLESATERFELQFEQSLERSLRVFEPLLLMLVGLIVFIIALAILLPVLTLNQGI